MHLASPPLAAGNFRRENGILPRPVFHFARPPKVDFDLSSHRPEFIPHDSLGT
jgi:hypothetical protein